MSEFNATLKYIEDVVKLIRIEETTHLIKNPQDATNKEAIDLARRIKKDVGWLDLLLHERREAFARRPK